MGSLTRSSCQRNAANATPATMSMPMMRGELHPSEYPSVTAKRRVASPIKMSTAP
ncbi:MAG: hypothetical protein A4E39_01642 [Methanoregulaceae archaeon PtaB.Bin152]|nr:MAG: hypothetical protein A4E39_01642 [Methanoregulaceae archaeon PtaB.Bin152]